LQQYQGLLLTSDGVNYYSSGVAPALAANGLVDPDQLPVATATITGAVRVGTCLEGTGPGNKVLGLTEVCRTVENRFGFPGPMSDSGASPKVPQYIATPQQIPANFAGAGCQSLVAPAANIIFTLKYRRSGANNTIGTLTFTPSGTTTLSTQAAFNLQVGDLLYLEAPVTPDTAAQDVACTIPAIRS
jgi:hypothetical protein